MLWLLNHFDSYKAAIQPKFLILAAGKYLIVLQLSYCCKLVKLLTISFLNKNNIRPISFPQARN